MSFFHENFSKLRNRSGVRSLSRLVVEGKTTKEAVAADSDRGFKALVDQNLTPEVFASHVYALFEKDGASKAIAAQYLAEHLEDLIAKEEWNAATLIKKIPPYIVQAIEYVTEPFPKEEEEPEHNANAEGPVEATIDEETAPDAKEGEAV